MTPPTDDRENYDDSGFPWIRPEDLDESGAITKSSKFLSEKGKALAREVQPGASLICCIGTIGKVGIVDECVSTNQQITAAEFSGSDRFFYLVTCAARTEFEITATGNVLKILNTERLGEVKYPVPPLVEQTAIATFLDRETTKIDALVAEQEKLIALLQEKRLAVISHAVTKGLDPNVTMKDSGVEWLGEVPGHWEPKRLKFLASNIKAGPFGSALTDRKSVV
jgi:type I restriction enzyme S subunit